MAKETLDACVSTAGLSHAGESQTDGLLLEGAHTWTPTLFIRLVQDVGVDSAVAKHLAETYGDRAFSVAKLAGLTGQRWPIVGKRLHVEYPYIEAEVREGRMLDRFATIYVMWMSRKSLKYSLLTKITLIFFICLHLLCFKPST